MDKPIKRTFLIEITDNKKHRTINIKRTNFGHHDLIGVLADIILKTMLSPDIGQEKKDNSYIG